VRPEAERLAATQFETLTAAALAHFAAEEVDAAVVEAGLGGRLDATNVLDARVVHLTNVSLEHADVLGETREQIAREKLAVAGPHAVVVLGEPEWARLVPANDVQIGGAREAAEAFLGRAIGAEAVPIALPGRLEWRSEAELWDGAHTPEGVDWLLGQLDRRDWVVVASLLRDKDVDGILRRLAAAGRTLVATRSSNARALPEKELATHGERYFERVEAAADPVEALALARGLGPVLATGSLYLLADLHARS
jgi:dihydrofolate synthase / folylpolyglutamate synthase